MKHIIDYIEGAVPIMEMARVGYIDAERGMPKLEVYIHTDDPGRIAHFHIRGAVTKGKEFETCIKIQKAEYFLHGRYKDRLNAHMLKVLDNFVRAKPKDIHYANNYEVIMALWNMNNSDVEIETENYVIPDYKRI